MDLADFQTRLVGYFEALRSHRQKFGFPIFAIEHDLSKTEINELHNLIKLQSQQHSPLARHWLPWIIYACELGYIYSGDEYWQTFEEQTPGWKKNGDRELIRKWFYKFHQEYYGAKPKGSWAEHFTIICWPITHALLPKDLQTQLAKILYEIRHSLDTKILNSPEELGKRIESHSFYASSRFRQFSQNHELLGGIASALIRHGTTFTDSLVSPQTLGRIVSDLFKVQTAREFLHKARASASQLEIHGLEKEKEHIPLLKKSREVAKREFKELGIQPTILLNRIPGNKWSVILEIPDFSNLLKRFPELCRILTESRCIVSCSSGPPLARRQLLFGTQSVKLSRWPDEDEVLLNFEEKVPELEFYTGVECFLEPGPIWLFRITDDNSAHQVKSLTIRPGNQYIIIHDKNYPQKNGPFMTKVEIMCDGIEGSLLDLPKVISLDEKNRLKELKLNVMTSIRFWPVGLPPLRWDGEGYSEWYISDEPCIAIQSDQPVQRMNMELDDSSSIMFRNVQPDYPIFVKLPKMSGGNHLLKVNVGPFEGTEEAMNGHMEFVMREPRSWVPGTCHSNVLIPIVDPPTPDLEHLWENKVTVVLHGPEYHKINPIISLYGRTSDDLLIQKELPTITIPLVGQQWKNYFDTNVRSKKDIMNVYDLSRSCKIEFFGGEIGTFILTAEREFTPLNWHIFRSDHSLLARLLDNMGTEGSTKVRFHSFGNPACSEEIQYKKAIAGLPVPESGGLLAADVKSSDRNYRQAIIVPPISKIKSLQELAIDPTIAPPISKSVEEIQRLLSLIELWAKARLAGDCYSSNCTSIIRQRAVLEKLLLYLLGIICGKQWQEAEFFFRQQPGSEFALGKLKESVSTKPYYNGFVAVLYRDYKNFLDETPANRIKWFSAELAKFSICIDEWLGEFALRLSTSPESVNTRYKERVVLGIQGLLKNVMVARAARFLVLLLDRCYTSKPIDPIPMYFGWD